MVLGLRPARPRGSRTQVGPLVASVGQPGQGQTPGESNSAPVPKAAHHPLAASRWHVLQAPCCVMFTLLSVFVFTGC